MTQAATTICPQCAGGGSIMDPDPYADRIQRITCPLCGGKRWMSYDKAMAWTNRAPEPAPMPTLVPVEQPPVESSGPALPNGVRLIGTDKQTGKALAAIVSGPLAPQARAAVYRRLVSDARQQMALAKRWDVWGVFASDSWAFQNRVHRTAP